MKKSTKLSYIATLVACTCLLAGCEDTTTNANINEGMTLIEQADYSSALQSFEAAMVYEEDEELLYRGQGLAYMGLGQYEDAIESFLTSIEYAEGNVTDLEFDINYYLASCYYKLGDYQNAISIYDAIIGLRGEEMQPHYLRACACLKAGDYDSALSEFQEALSIEPENIDLVKNSYLEMNDAGYTAEGESFVQSFMDENSRTLTDAQKGELYYYLGDYEDARIYLDSALNSGDSESSLLLGKTYEMLGDMNYASVVYNTYLETSTPNAAIYNSLGNCLMAQEKYEEALVAYESGIEMGDTGYLKELKYNQIVAYEYCGQFDRAKALMEEYIVLYPDDSDAQREYLFLQTR